MQNVHMADLQDNIVCACTSSIEKKYLTVCDEYMHVALPTCIHCELLHGYQTVGGGGGGGGHKKINNSSRVQL